MLASYERVSDEPDSLFVQRLIRDHGVATIPVSAFYHDGTDQRVIRLSFSRMTTPCWRAPSACAPSRGHHGFTARCRPPDGLRDDLDHNLTQAEALLRQAAAEGRAGPAARIFLPDAGR